MNRNLSIALLAALAVASDSAGQPPFYAGTWTIESATVAPWWAGKVPPDASWVRALEGKTIEFSVSSITGPDPLSCRSPRYAVRSYPADYLFQGNFGEMKRRDPRANPVALAASLGFHGKPSWRTLETGCEGGIGFHFRGSNSAAFALDNHIFTIRRRP